MFVEGLRLAEEVLAAHAVVVEAAISSQVFASTRGQDLVRALEASGVRPRLLDDRVLRDLSEVQTSQGIVAIARRPVFVEEDLFRHRPPLLAVLAGLQDPGNLGAVLRTAEASGASGAYLAAGTADPFSWKALRGAMGSAFRLPHLRGLEPEAVLERLRSRGIASIATVAEGGMPFDRVDFGRPVALWLGNEGAGLPAAVVQAAEERVTIPMAARVESLNVAVAAGVLLFEAARQRRTVAR
jgi:TrmH family RNA methyltransferase